MAKTQQVLTTPPQGTIVPEHSYGDDQKAKIQALREVRTPAPGRGSWSAKPAPSIHQYAETELLPESDPYRPWELRWLNKSDTMPRYMRAAKWNLEDAKRRLKDTMEWRRDFKPDLIAPDEVRITFIR